MRFFLIGMFLVCFAKFTLAAGVNSGDVFYCDTLEMVGINLQDNDDYTARKYQNGKFSFMITKDEIIFGDSSFLKNEIFLITLNEKYLIKAEKKNHQLSLDYRTKPMILTHAGTWFKKSSMMVATCDQY